MGTVKVTNATGFSFAPTSNASYTFITIKTTGPNYFFPRADVYTAITTPYAKYAENFTVYGSTDNSTWVQIPIQIPVQDTFSAVQIGTAPLNGFSFTIYYKIYFPYQNITVQNQTLTFFQFGESINNRLIFSPSPTPETTVIFILLIIAVFSFVLQIVDFVFRNDEKNT